MKDNWYRTLEIIFEDGREETFLIEMTVTGTFKLDGRKKPAGWTRLDFCKCACCPLDESTSVCPAAESLESTIMRFKDCSSFEPVEAVAVDDAGRHTHITSTLQKVGAVFVQLAVFSSGCPIGKRLRPLLRDARPFATNKELASHLVGNLLLKNRGDVAQARRDVQQLVEPLHIVFNRLSDRINKQEGSGDAVQNAIICLDAFAVNVSLRIDTVLDEIIKEMGWDKIPRAGTEPEDDGISDRAAPKDGNRPAAAAGKGIFARVRDLFAGR